MERLAGVGWVIVVKESCLGLLPHPATPTAVGESFRIYSINSWQHPQSPTLVSGVDSS